MLWSCQVPSPVGDAYFPALNSFFGTSALSHIPAPRREVLGLSLTQVHVSGFGSLGIGHPLVDSVQQLLFHLRDGVAVQHLDRDLRGILVLGIHAVEGLHSTGGAKRLK